jgi:hypothetical protein
MCEAAAAAESINAAARGRRDWDGGRARGEDCPFFPLYRSSWSVGPAWQVLQVNNSAYFLKFVEILRIQYGPNLIIAKSTVYEFKKIKIREICKKLDIIVRLLVKKFFQIGIVWLVKI